MRSHLCHRVTLLVPAVILLLGIAPATQAPPPAAERTLVAVTLQVTPNVATPAGQPIVLKAVVARIIPSPNAPTGAIEFFDQDTSLGTASIAAANGLFVATLNADALAAGSHMLRARYVGDDRYAPSESMHVTHLVTNP